MAIAGTKPVNGKKAELVNVEQNGGQIKATFRLGTGQWVPFYNTSASNRASARVMQRYEPLARLRYSSSDTPIYDLTQVPEKFQDQVKLARTYYHQEPITGTTIDCLVQFSNGHIEHVTEDERVKKFFDAIYETSNIKDTLQWAFTEYYVAGNVFPYRSPKGEMVQAQNGEQVPQYSWTVLNPEAVDIKGSLFFDLSVITVKPNDDLKSLANANTPELKRLWQALPPEIRKALVDGGDIVVDSNQVYHIARSKMPFERFAVPFIMRAVLPLSVKYKLIQMDLSTADGVINQLVTVTTGNDEYPATQEDLIKLGELLNTPNKAYALVWNHTLNVQFNKPEANFFNSDKYQQVNEDIKAAYGIVRAVVSDKGTYAGQTISVKSLIKWLEAGREDVKHWLEREYKLIAEENGLPTYPKVRFKQVDLHEERTIKNVLLSLYQNGIISAETVLEETEHEFTMELERLRREKEIRENEDILIPMSPWQQSKEQETPEGNPPQPGPGRPPEEEDNTPRERDPEPAPHGASLQVTMAAAEDENEIDEYTSELALLYISLESHLKDMLSRTLDNDIQDAVLVASLMAFLNDMDATGARYILPAMQSAYVKNTTAPVETDLMQQWQEKTLSWNYEHLNNLSNDMRTAIKERLEKPLEYTVDKAVEEVMQANRYRIGLFGQEGIRTARFRGTVLGLNEEGYNRGRWDATFERTCEECASRHGQYYSLSELMDLYPAHPNEQCTIVFLR